VIFLHRTTESAWDAIQREGFLWGTHDGRSYRYTYLAPSECAPDPSFGPVLLEVDYTPRGCGSGVDNYGFDPPPGEVCWQFSVFVPIPLAQVRRVE
jgi:hypothetical protein